jgi:hypothetical protein
MLKGRVQLLTATPALLVLLVGLRCQFRLQLQLTTWEPLAVVAGAGVVAVENRTNTVLAAAAAVVVDHQTLPTLLEALLGIT